MRFLPKNLLVDEGSLQPGRKEGLASQEKSLVPSFSELGSLGVLAVDLVYDEVRIRSCYTPQLPLFCSTRCISSFTSFLLITGGLLQNWK